MKTKRTILKTIQRSIANLQQQLTRFERKLTMKIDEVLTKIDTSTTDTAARVQALIDSIRAEKGTLTPEQEAEAALIVGHLEAIGSDPANPVPPIEPSAL